ncbi:MAG: efflux RND transporter periplasmic adaptor subunit [Candidatus Zixiibacteriota bacterium]
MLDDRPGSDLSSLRIDKDKKFADAPKSKKWLILVWLTVAAALVLAYFLLKKKVTPATSVKVATVELLTGSAAQADLVATGYVVAQREAEVASKGTGRLVFLGFEEGDDVKKGQIIASLDNDDIKANLEQAKANQLQAEVDTLNRGRDYNRQKGLFDRGAIPRSLLEDAEAGYRASLANHAASVAAVRATDVGLENTYIRAPFDGTILTKNADIGDIVAPFASSASSKGSVVTLADMSSLEVEADVSESYIHKVSTGQRCEIILDAYPNEIYQGKVKKIVPTADRSRATVLTKVSFDKIDVKVLPEMSARVNFFIGGSNHQTNAAEAVLVVLKEAITARDNQKVIFVIDGERVRMQNVTVGRELGNVTEIISGLSRGDQVVLTPPGKMVDGEKVEISK